MSDTNLIGLAVTTTVHYLHVIVKLKQQVITNRRIVRILKIRTWAQHGTLTF